MLIRWKSGRPTPLPMPGLFLLAPDVDFAIHGINLQHALEAALIDDGMPPVRAHGVARGVIRGLKRPSLRSTPTVKAMRNFIATKMPSLMDLVEQSGPVRPWLTADHGVRTAIIEGIPWIRYYADVEDACVPAHRALIADQVNRAADLVESLDVMRPVLWPGALERMRIGVAGDSKALLARLPVLMELRLSALLSMEVDAKRCYGLPQDFSFSPVLPETDDPQEPVRRAVRLLLVSAGFDPIEKLLDGLPDRAGLDAKTVARWKRYPEQISDQYLIRIADELPSHVNGWALSFSLIAARKLRLLMQLWHPLMEYNTNKAHGNLPACVPWGHAHLSEWLSERATFWREYHAAIR